LPTLKRQAHDDGMKQINPVTVGKIRAVDEGRDLTLRFREPWTGRSEPTLRSDKAPKHR